MKRAKAAGGRTLGSYLTGYVLALVLTAVPFGIAATGALSMQSALIAIGASAIVQVLVHLRYFLHLGLRSTPQERLLAIAFTAVLILIMIGGSLWIMLNLYYRMWA
ncbi:cytochrome o ubiquinol oxidase subunit IV [Microbulbifer hainanensis]|uniref:cytochrome o ubiquinol oxidase subunit IV n=1 Tax=Microbulbifer hainanensis TaxID=2735675 RepID=UPI00186778CE|nr:cytochrome o ubiquinol oxidase subunit IV [Microbulbifer hainanensis]